MAALHATSHGPSQDHLIKVEQRNSRVPSQMETLDKTNLDSLDDVNNIPYFALLPLAVQS